MLAQTLNAGEGRSAAAAVGGGRADGMRANGGSPASAAPLPPDNSDIDPLATYTRYVGFPHRAQDVLSLLCLCFIRYYWYM